MVLLIGFWSTGIFFPMDTIVMKYPILAYANPLIGVVHNARACILPNIEVNYAWLMINLFLAIIISVTGLLVFHKIVHSAVEKI